MKQSIRKGFSFGLTSGVITTLGLMIGLYSSTHLKLAVIGGIITIAVADAMSDALGIHISEESDAKRSHKDVWRSTFATFFSKFLIAITFIIPVLFFELFTAIIISVIWGFLLISFLSYKIAVKEKKKSWKVISEHLIIAIFVVVVTYYLGILIALLF